MSYNSGSPRPSGSRSFLDRIETMLMNKKLRKFSFYLLLLFLAMLTTYDLVKLIRVYLTDNVETEMRMQFNETITMPNLTFCISEEHAWSHFNVNRANDSEIDAVVAANLANMTSREEFLKKPWNQQMIVDAYIVIKGLNSIEREADALGSLGTIMKVANSPRMFGFRQSMKKWLNVIAQRNVTFDEFQQKVGSETLSRSLHRFQRLGGAEDGRQIRNSVRITWLSQNQLCFQPYFDQTNFKPIIDQDQFFTLSLAHNTENVERIECMMLDAKGRPSSEARFAEGKGRANDGFFDELCIGEEHDIILEIRAIYTSLPDSEKQETKCLEYAKMGTNELDCRSRCRLELIRAACSCTPLTLSYLAGPEDLQKFPLCDYEKCQVERNPKQMNYSTWDSQCGDQCYPDCTQTRYVLHHSKRTGRKEMVQVTLFWGSFEYLWLLQKEKWSFSKFFSNLGGSLGVWLGLSVLSVIQFITYLLTRAHKRVIRKISTISNDGRRAAARRGQSQNSSDGGAGMEQTRQSPLGGSISMNPFGKPKKEKQ